MRFRQDSPVPSLSHAFSNTWQSLNSKTNGKKTKLQDTPLKFKWTVNDEDGQEIKNSLFDSLSSPIEDFIDEQCLHFEENFVKHNDSQANFIDNFDELNEKFSRISEECDKSKSFFRSQSSTDSVFGSKICKKCGHDITRL